MGETIGERRDWAQRQRVLERISESLRLPHLRDAIQAERNELEFTDDPGKRQARADRVTKLQHEIRVAESTLGIPDSNPTKED